MKHRDEVNTAVTSERTPLARGQDSNERPLLEVEELVKHYPVAHGRAVVSAVNGVSFQIYPGETLGLVGESGSGKSTVAHCIMRLTEVTEGKILFEGSDISRHAKRQTQALRQKVQLVFQEPFDSLDPRMHVEEIIAEPLAVQKVDRTERARRVRDILQLVHLPGRILDAYPHELSGGLQQRVGIARAFITQPHLVVLDEPTSALDPRARRQIIDLLRELQERTGIAYLFITHDLNTLRQLAHRIAVMYLGCIVEEGPTDAIFSEQRHPYTRALLSSVLYPDPDTRRDRFELTGEIPSPIDLPNGCYLASRCPLSMEECTRAVPPLVSVGEKRTSACIRHELVPTVESSSKRSTAIANRQAR